MIEKTDNYERKNRISEALSIRGMKQVELCEKSGVKKSSLNHWIKQRWQPKQKALFSMARALDVSEMWLAGYDCPMERAPEQKKADELVKITHLLRKDDNLRNLLVSICKLNPSQYSIVENMVNEFNKVNDQN